MTVYYAESFNGASDAADIDDYMLRRGHDAWADQAISTGRVSGISLLMYGTRYWRIPVTLGASYTIGFAVWTKYWLMLGTVPVKFLFMTSDAGVNEHITLSLVPDGEMAVITAAETVCTSGLQGKNQSWMYVEFKFTIHNTTGSYTLKVNGKTYLTRTGIDTFSGGSIGVDEFDFDYKGGGAYYVYIDDVYIADDFLGDIRNDRIDPNGDGAINDGTPQGAGDSYIEVDDGNAVDDDTTYITSDDTHQDLFTYDDLSALGTIHAVQMNVVCREIDATAFNIMQLVYIGTTIYDEASIAITDTNYEIIDRVMTVDPSTSTAWTLTTINDAQFGFEADAV